MRVLGQPTQHRDPAGSPHRQTGIPDARGAGVRLPTERPRQYRTFKGHDTPQLGSAPLWRNGAMSSMLSATATIPATSEVALVPAFPHPCHSASNSGLTPPKSPETSEKVHLSDALRASSSATMEQSYSLGSQGHSEQASSGAISSPPRYSTGSSTAPTSSPSTASASGFTAAVEDLLSIRASEPGRVLRCGRSLSVGVDHDEVVGAVDTPGR